MQKLLRKQAFNYFFLFFILFANGPPRGLMGHMICYICSLSPNNSLHSVIFLFCNKNDGSHAYVIFVLYALNRPKSPKI